MTRLHPQPSLSDAPARWLHFRPPGDRTQRVQAQRSGVAVNPPWAAASARVPQPAQRGPAASGIDSLLTRRGSVIAEKVAAYLPRRCGGYEDGLRTCCGWIREWTILSALFSTEVGSRLCMGRTFYGFLPPLSGARASATREFKTHMTSRMHPIIARERPPMSSGADWGNDGTGRFDPTRKRPWTSRAAARWSNLDWACRHDVQQQEPSQAKESAGQLAAQRFIRSNAKAQNRPDRARPPLLGPIAGTSWNRLRRGVL